MSQFLSNTTKTIQQIYLDGFRLWKKTYTKLISLQVSLFLLNILSFIVVHVLYQNQVSTSEYIIRTHIVIEAIFFIVFFYGFGFAFHRILFFAEDKTTTVRRSLLKTFRLLPTFLVAVILVNIVFAFGIALLVIPGLIAFTYYTMVAPSIFREQYGPIDAIRHSCNLVSGNFWRTCAVTTVPAVVTAAIVLVINYNIISFSMIYTNGNLANVIFTSIIISLVTTIASTLYLSLVAIQFNDLKVRFTYHEQHTLEHAVEI